MKRCIVLVAFLVLNTFGEIRTYEYETYETPPVDPTDYVLIVYPLTEKEVAAFSTSDGKVSDFWSSPWWQERDWIDLNTEHHSYPGRNRWDGAEDAAVRIQAGATASGLYLYLEVTDDIFVDPVGAIDDSTNTSRELYDALTVFIDYMNSEKIINRSKMESARPNAPWDLTISSQQFLCWMGATGIPTRFRWSYYNDIYWDWWHKALSLEEAETLLDGMRMEAIIVDETRKAQEWFFSWEQLGTGGVAGLLDCRRFAFTAGYNDMDGDDTGVNSLRWKQGDPYNEKTTLSLAKRCTAGTFWGDLHMAEGIGETIIDHEVADCFLPWPQCSAFYAITVIRQKMPELTGTSIISAEYFTLQGRKLAPEAARRMLRSDGAALVRRGRLRDGTFRSALILKPGE